MQIQFEHETKVRVRYGETDQMGYCYYGNYAQYFEVGRVEALRAFGMSYKELENQGIMLPVSEFSVKYMAPAFYDEELLIRTKITGLSGARITFEYEILNEIGKVISKAHTILVFVAKNTMRPISPPDFFLDLMKQFEKQ
jgi:acyl-CoA thioester hydrolase